MRSRGTACAARGAFLFRTTASRAASAGHQQQGTGRAESFIRACQDGRVTLLHMLGGELETCSLISKCVYFPITSIAALPCAVIAECQLLAHFEQLTAHP